LGSLRSVGKIIIDRDSKLDIDNLPEHLKDKIIIKP